MYQNKEFTSSDIGEAFGFVYRIINTITGQTYIGRKYFFSVRRKKPLKGRKNKRVFRKESDWRDYFGSSEDLKADIEKLGQVNFKREIITVYRTKGEVNYNETRLLFGLNVLDAVDEKGNKMYYNTSIMGRWFPKNKVEHGN